MKGLKHNPYLKPLSRDHLIALMAAQKLTEAGLEPKQENRRPNQ